MSRDGAPSRWGFVGVGAMGLIHARAATACGAEIVAAVARRPDSTNWYAFGRHAPNVRCETHIDALIDDSTIDPIVALRELERHARAVSAPGGLPQARAL